ncbi:MAG TPA: hypothetical protein VE976_00245 [Actinomycetota bacterium]|nr:hypothetical protein [Actinomycetota bacterium]
MSEAVASPPRLGRARWWPSLLVTAVLAAVTFGGFGVGAALSQPAGPAVVVAGVLRVQPLSGWELATRFDHPPGARLSRGNGNLDCAAVPFRGSALDLAREYVDQVLRPGARRLSVSSSVEPVRLASGLTGIRFGYVGTFGRAQVQIEGEVTAVVSPNGVGVVFDGWAPAGLLQYVLDDIRTMVDTARIR